MGLFKRPPCIPSHQISSYKLAAQLEAANELASEILAGAAPMDFGAIHAEFIEIEPSIRLNMASIFRRIEVAVKRNDPEKYGRQKAIAAKKKERERNENIVHACAQQILERNPDAQERRLAKAVHDCLDMRGESLSLPTIRKHLRSR